MTGLSVNFFTLSLAQVKYIVYLWRINLKNETILDFQPSKDVVMIRRLKDLNEWDDLLYIVVDGKLYSRKYYKK